MDLLSSLVNTFATEPVLVGNWRIKCPYCGQVDPVDGATRQHPCSKCGEQTRVNNGFNIACANPECPQADHVTNFTKMHQCSVCGSSKGDIKPVRKPYTIHYSLPSHPAKQTRVNIANQGLHIDFAQLRLLRLIGEGNFGEIYEALLNGNKCAVKRLKLSNGNKEQLIKEAQALEQLQHECIVCLKGTATDPSTNETVIVMEYMADGSLDDLLSRDGAHLSRADVIQIALDVAHGLHYLHSQKIIHRDLKGANVLLYNNKKRAKISDFGTVRIFDKSTKALTIVGTMGFIAPEILQEKPYNSMADIYSFGVLMYQMLTRKPLPILFTEESRAEKIRSEVHDTDFQDLIINCCRMEPTERPTIDSCIEKLRTLEAK